MAQGENRTPLFAPSRENDFECPLCKNVVQGKETMVEHLEKYTCTPRAEEGTLTELKRHWMNQDMKWRIAFSQWLHFRQIVRDNNKVEFDKTYLDYCRTCKTYEQHKAGGCDSRVARGKIISHLLTEAHQHYYAWAATDQELTELAVNKAHEERIEAANFADLLYIADELWPEMRATQRASMELFEERITNVRKELWDLFNAEQELYARLDAGGNNRDPRAFLEREAQMRAAMEAQRALIEAHWQRAQMQQMQQMQQMPARPERPERPVARPEVPGRRHQQRRFIGPDNWNPRGFFE